MNDIISIIIPAYNVEAYLTPCLTSVCGQTEEKIEIIVVNDGSTDGSLDIIKRWAKKDSRIKVISQENQGLSAARNTGIENASGEYLMFVDGDDWIDKATCAEAKQMLTHIGADIVMWSYSREYSTSSKPVSLFGEHRKIWRDEQTQEVFQRLVGLNGEQLKNPQMTDSIVTAWGKLYKRDVIGDIRFVDTKIIGTEDALFNIEVFNNARCIGYLPSLFSHYRKTNETSLSHTYKNQLVFQWKELYRRINAFLNQINAGQELYAALDNRISLGLIGLGLNIIEDSKLSCRNKCVELKKILNMPHYKKALSNLPMQYLPIHWKAFFMCAKCKSVPGMYFMLLTMNYLRGK